MRTAPDGENIAGEGNDLPFAASARADQQHRSQQDGPIEPLAPRILSIGHGESQGGLFQIDGLDAAATPAAEVGILGVLETARGALDHSDRIAFYSGSASVAPGLVTDR